MFFWLSFFNKKEINDFCCKKCVNYLLRNVSFQSQNIVKGHLLFVPVYILCTEKRRGNIQNLTLLKKFWKLRWKIEERVQFAYVSSWECMIPTFSFSFLFCSIIHFYRRLFYQNDKLSCLPFNKADIFYLAYQVLHDRYIRN